MPRAGLYRNRVRVERFVTASDAAGGEARTWETVIEVQAQIMEMAPGQELFGAGTEVAAGTVRVRMRELPDYPEFDPAWRLIDVDRGTILEIVSILPTRLGDEITVLCTHGGLKR